MIQLINQNIQPLFICGYPKSGTTLLLSLLDYHSELLVFPEETRFWIYILPMIRSGMSRNKILEFLYEETGIAFFKKGKHDLPRRGNVDYSEINFDQYRQILEMRWKRSKYSTKGLLEAIVFAYGDVTNQPIKSKKYWVEKTPGNEAFAGNIMQFFPEASFLYTVRDPRANYDSYKKKKEAIDDRQFELQTFLLGWIGSLRSARKIRNWLNCDRGGVLENTRKFIPVVYHQLVSSPVTVMKKIAFRLAISWEEGLLIPSRKGLKWDGNSMHGTKFEGISSDSLTKWQSGLSKEEIEILEIFTGKAYRLADESKSCARILFGRIVRFIASSHSLSFIQRLKLIATLFYTRIRRVPL